MPDLNTLAETILATVTGVSLNTATKQNLYTVPPGKTAIVTKVVARNASTDISTADGDFGFDASCTNWVQDVNFTNLTAAGLLAIIRPHSGDLATPDPESVDEGAAGEAFGYEGGTLVAATCDMDVHGYLV